MQKPPPFYAHRRIKKGKVNHFLGDHGSLWWYPKKINLPKTSYFLRKETQVWEVLNPRTTLKIPPSD
jgi:hypothetical protein